MTNAEINQKFAEKVAKGIFRPVIRHITGNDPEERLRRGGGPHFRVVREEGPRRRRARRRAPRPPRSPARGGPGPASREVGADDPASLVVLASIALDLGDMREAARLIARLRAAALDAGEGRLLDALARERAARPGRDWATSGLAGLVAVQPLPEFTPLISVWNVLLGDELGSRAMGMPFPEEAASRLPVSDRFLARWAWPHPSGVDPILLGEGRR